MLWDLVIFMGGALSSGLLLVLGLAVRTARIEGKVDMLAKMSEQATTNRNDIQEMETRLTRAELRIEHHMTEN